MTLILALNACVEPIEIELENEESILVIEGIITDELQKQEITLSRSFAVDENGPNPVTNATVLVNSSDGNSYSFSENEDGQYLSIAPFKVELGKEYSLQIETANGVYESSMVSSDSETQISDVSSELATVNGEEGVAITLSNTAGPSGNSFYLFKYQETYEIRSRYEKINDIIYNEDEDPDDPRDDFFVIPKPEQDYVCYITEPSTDIILSNTEGLSENTLDGFLIRFIAKSDYELSYRYSIAVTQLKVSSIAYDYYETLKNLSENESIFSQYQPGFLSGNIKNMSNEGEKVIGYFTTATTDTERLFFNYTDYFDRGNTRPSHVAGECEEFLPSKTLLIDLLATNQVRFFMEDPPFTYHVIRRGCVDCTLYGTNEKPEFWID